MGFYRFKQAKLVGDRRTQVLNLFDKKRRDMLAHHKACKLISVRNLAPKGTAEECKPPEKVFKTPQEKAEYHLRQAAYLKRAAELVASISESRSQIEQCLNGH